MKGNLPSMFLEWLVSYLQGRYQYVCLNNYFLSNMIPVTSGVPQGSVISPFLFAAHMGSLKPFDSRTIMTTKYADDIVSNIPVNDLTEAERLIFNEINRIPQIKSFEHSMQLKILGLMYTVDLKWDTHVEQTIKKASQRIFILKQLKKFLSIQDLVRIYNAMILIVLEYCAPVMGGMTAKNSEKIEKLRRRCHRIICGNECKCELLPPISERRLEQASRLFIKLTDPTHILNHLIPDTLPRTKHYIIEATHTDRRQRSFISFISLHLNKQKQQK